MDCPLIFVFREETSAVLWLVYHPGGTGYFLTHKGDDVSLMVLILKKFRLCMV